MGYIAVLNYDSRRQICTVGEFTDLPTLDLHLMYELPLNFLSSKVVKDGLKPINFSIDRNGKVLQDCGAFTRFHKDGSVIILAELVTKSGAIKGYRIFFSGNNNVGNIMKDALKQKVEQAAESGIPYIQNGIYRQGKINCYPLKPFLRVQLSSITPVKKQEVQPQVEPKPVKQQVAKNASLDDLFTQKQRAEIHACRSAGIDPQFILNPELDAEQMRVLWVSKRNGALSEYFAKPDYSVDVMKFYADRLVSKTIVKECAGMLNHPELSVEQLNELYLCVCSGVPYEDLLELSHSDIYLVRLARDLTAWGDAPIGEKYIDTELLEKATLSVMKMKGLI